MTLWPIEAVSEFQAEREDSLRPQRHLTPLPYHRRSPDEVRMGGTDGGRVG